MARCRSPLKVVINGRDECSACGVGVIGYGPTLRHEGEAIPRIVPDPKDAAAVADANEVAIAVARRMPPEATDEDIARAVAEALYTRGYLRQRPGQARYNVVLDDPEPREPDARERAAGMTAEVVSAA